MAIIQFCFMWCIGLTGKHQILIDRTKTYQTFEEFGTSSCWWAQTIEDENMADEIAEKLAITPDKVREIMKIAQDPVSLETPIGEEDDSHLGDFIPDGPQK